MALLLDTHAPPALATTGNSVCVFVHGFEPYFYIEKPPAMSHEDIETMTQMLNVGVLLVNCACVLDPVGHGAGHMDGIEGLGP